MGAVTFTTSQVSTGGAWRRYVSQRHVIDRAFQQERITADQALAARTELRRRYNAGEL